MTVKAVASVMLLALLAGVPATASAQTHMAFDLPVNNASVKQPFLIQGWAFNAQVPTGTGVDAVHVWACPTACSGTNGIFLGGAQYGDVPRPDVRDAFQLPQRFTDVGYQLVVSGVAPGLYQVVVYARKAGTVDDWTAAVHVLTIEPSPKMFVDAPAHLSSQPQTFPVTGWALDAAASTGTGVDHVTMYAYPNPGSGTPAIQLVPSATLNGDRNDVRVAFGLADHFRFSGFQAPLSNLAVGSYYLIVYARSSVTGLYQAQGLVVYVFAAQNLVSLTIDRSGSGSGSVSNGTIACDGGGSGNQTQRFCTAMFLRGTSMNLTATPHGGSTFTGWGGICSGPATCAVTLNTDLLVSARFVATTSVATTFYHLDALGSVRAVTASTSPTVLARHDYLPFGESTSALGGDPMRFTGKELDAESGLQYFGMRYYRNTVGRFTSVDPGAIGARLADPQSWNAYAYAANNPMRFVDPSGLWVEEVHNQIINAAFGGRLTAAQLQLLRTISARQDVPRGLDERNAHEHSLASGDPARAAEKTAGFIAQQSGMAVAALKAGNTDEALAAFSRLLHAKLDDLSPSHRGYQRTPSSVAGYAAHLLRERKISARDLADAVETSHREFMKIFGNWENFYNTERLAAYAAGMGAQVTTSTCFTPGCAVVR